MAKQTFTLQELQSFDGKKGRPAYVALQGKVYDVSASFLWKGGQHFVGHAAGSDLTEALGHAPHGKELLERFLVVGNLKTDNDNLPA